MRQTKRSFWLLILFITSILWSCNSEEDVLPLESPSFIKIMPGLGFEDIPVRVIPLNEGGNLSGFLVLSNTTSFVEGVNSSKIRMTHLSEMGEIINDTYFPANSNESWSALDVNYSSSDNIIIAGNVRIGNEGKILFLQTNLAGDSLKSVTKSVENTSINLVGININGATNDLIFLAALNSGANNTMLGALNTETLNLEWSKIDRARAIPSTSILAIGNHNFSWGYNANNNTEIARTDTTFRQSESTFLQFPSASLTRAKSLFNQEGGEGITVFGEAVINSTKKVFYHNTLNNNFQQLGKAGNNNTLRKVNKVNDGYLISGNTEITVPGTNNFQKDFLLIKTNENGFPQFTQSFGTSDDEELFDAIIANESIYALGLTIFGDRNSMVFIKTNLKGELKN